MKIKFIFWSNIQALDLGTFLQFKLGVHCEEVVHGFQSPTARLTFPHVLLSFLTSLLVAWWSRQPIHNGIVFPFS